MGGRQELTADDAEGADGAEDAEGGWRRRKGPRDAEEAGVELHVIREMGAEGGAGGGEGRISRNM